MAVPSAPGRGDETTVNRSIERIPVRAWLLVFAWIGVILMLSSGEFSAHQTSRIIGPLLDWLFPELPQATRALIHGFVRKGAHVTEYGILALLALRALRQSLHARPTPPALAPGLALGLVLIIASIDESGQARNAVRTGSPKDVAIDLCGGALALSIGWWAEPRIRRRYRRTRSAAVDAEGKPLDAEPPKAAPTQEASRQ